jgi:threonine-phosphate decarboxylase
MTVQHGGNIFAISRERGWDWRDVADFSASINPLGPSPKVADAIRAALDRIPHYPEREPARLREALAHLWEIDQEQILLGNGATELLHFFARVERSGARTHACSVGTHADTTLAVPVFSEFFRAYPSAHCVPAANPEHWPQAGLLVLTQPNNPTGQTLPPAVLEDWLLNTHNPVIIDESFLEFTGLPSAARLLNRRPHLYVLRSLTKFYALPGLRVGALLASSEALARWRPQREPWQVNVLAEEAAMAAIGDRDHGRRTLQFVAAERDWLRAQLSLLPGVRVHPSCANYLLLDLDYPASQLYDYLLESKILVRVCTGSPGIAGEAVRIAVRARVDNERLIAAWKEYRCSA